MIAANTKPFLIASRVSCSPSQTCYIFNIFTSFSLFSLLWNLSHWLLKLRCCRRLFTALKTVPGLGQFLRCWHSLKQMKKWNITEGERSADKTSLTHSLQAPSCVSCVQAGWHLSCSGPSHSMAPSLLRLGTGLPTQGELDMVKKKKKLKNPYPLQGRELSDPARSERRQKGQRAESQVTGDGDSQCCFIWSNLSGIVESFQKAPTNHSLWVWCPFASKVWESFWKNL